MSLETKELCPLCGKRKPSKNSYDIQLCTTCDMGMVKDLIEEQRRSIENLHKRIDETESNANLITKRYLKLKNFMDEIGCEDVDCTCESNYHPRECKRHPWAHDLHVMELNYENASQDRDKYNQLKERPLEFILGKLENFLISKFK